MTDAPPPSGPPPSPSGGGAFCGECGAALEAGAAFCGNCGTATPAAVAAAGAPPPSGPAEGASNWTGVQPVIERPGDAPTAAMPATPPPSAGPPAGGPPSGGPPAGGPPPTATGAKKGKGPLVAVILLLLVALGAGAFFVLGGDDDETAGDDTTTTTEADDETTTTTEADGGTTTTAVDDTTTTVEIPGVEFVSLTDATGQLTVEVPSDWTDVSLALEGSENLANIQASTDLAAFRSGFEVPGMSFSLLPTPPANGDFDAVLDFLAQSVNLPNACVSAGKQDYSDGVFTGRFEVWQECAGIGTQLVLISAAQADGRAIEINVQLPSDQPIEIANHIAETFFIVG